MYINELSYEDKNELWDYIGKNKTDFFFEIREFTTNFAKTRFYLAKEGNQKIGLMCYNQAGTLRLFGSIDTVKEFFSLIDFTPKYLSVPIEFESFLPSFIKSEKRRLNMLRLVKQKSDVQLNSKISVVNLEKKQMQEALEVFQAAEPEDWLSSEAEKLPFDEINQWYGIQKTGKFVSICWNEIYPHGGHIAFIATHPHHQRRGFASTLIKYSLAETFKQSEFAIIHVRKDNFPALTAYRKLGYLDHMNYLVLCDPKLL